MHGKKSISPDLDSGGKLAQIYTNMTKIDLEIKTNLNIQIQFFCYNWNKGKWAIFIKPKPPSGWKFADFIFQNTVAYLEIEA